MLSGSGLSERCRSSCMTWAWAYGMVRGTHKEFFPLPGGRRQHKQKSDKTGRKDMRSSFIFLVNLTQWIKTIFWMSKKTENNTSIAPASHLIHSASSHSHSQVFRHLVFTTHHEFFWWLPSNIKNGKISEKENKCMHIIYHNIKSWNIE